MVSFGKDTKGKRKLVVTPETGEPKEYLIPKGKHISVHEADKVRAGEPLMDGSANPHDILRVLGVKELAKYLVDEVQEVYRLQGVKINDKHIETIVRQMLRKVKVKDAGDTSLLIAEQVERHVFEEENDRCFPGQEAGCRGASSSGHNKGIAFDGASYQRPRSRRRPRSLQGRPKIDYLLTSRKTSSWQAIPAGTGFQKI